MFTVECSRYQRLQQRPELPIRFGKPGRNSGLWRNPRSHGVRHQTLSAESAATASSSSSTTAATETIAPDSATKNGFFARFWKLMEQKFSTMWVNFFKYDHFPFLKPNGSYWEKETSRMQRLLLWVNLILPTPVRKSFRWPLFDQKKLCILLLALFREIPHNLKSFWK